MAGGSVAGGSPGSGRVHKRVLSDQQKRRDLALKRQIESRRNLQQHARLLASVLVPLSESGDCASLVDCDSSVIWVEERSVVDADGLVDEHRDYGTGWHGDCKMDEKEMLPKAEMSRKEVGLYEGTKLKGAKAREWFSQQLTLPEWMVDLPVRLKEDWYVLARPAGKRCIVVSSHGTTVSRLRNGRVLHCFPSALPNGSRACGVVTPSHTFCILDCVFHEPDQTYYITDMMCWCGYSLYDCNFEFRYFWMNSKLAETGALSSPSAYHKYCFRVAPVYECDVPGLQAAYSGPVPFARDGLLFYNRHAHYVLGLTPLVLLWKDANCSQYYLDTDSKGNVPPCQQVVLKLQGDGTVVTSDDPPVTLGSMPQKFLQQVLCFCSNCLNKYHFSSNKK
eukprot:c26526_g1_i2 orf=34-1209(+)